MGHSSWASVANMQIAVSSFQGLALSSIVVKNTVQELLDKTRLVNYQYIHTHHVHSDQGGGNFMPPPPTFGQQLCFLEISIHLTSELMLKNRKKHILVLNLFSVKNASLYNTLNPGIFQATCI